MSITKAIIPVAGWGTRRLPITKTIEKSMLPIGNRPLIDYIVQDCVVAGITDIYFVVSREDSQLEQYYRQNVELEEYLVANNKSSMLPLIEVPKVNFHYVVQPMNSKYGTTIPVALCAEYIKGESAVVLMGDDFMFAPDRPNQVQQLLSAVAADGSAMLGVEVPREQVSKYGVLKTNASGQFEEIVEKPKVDEAPSNLINVSKYVMNSHLLGLVSDHAAEQVIGEYYITEPINRYVAQGGGMLVVPAQGDYLDGGTLEGWLKANRVVVGSD